MKPETRNQKPETIMPIEIKELVIRAAVSEGNTQQPVSPAVSSDIVRMKREIADEVTERVLKILKKNNER
jgi:hypothetical protein